jgi:hypothetical protein
VLSDIIKTSLCYRSRTVHLSLPPFTISSGNKKPRLQRVSRVREIFAILQNLPTPSVSNLPSRRRPVGATDKPGLNAQPGLYRLCVAFATDIVGRLMADMLMQFLISNAKTNITASWLQSTYTFGGGSILNSNIRID